MSRKYSLSLLNPNVDLPYLPYELALGVFLVMALVSITNVASPVAAFLADKILIGCIYFLWLCCVQLVHNAIASNVIGKSGAVIKHLRFDNFVQVNSLASHCL
ncbi:hypothetical protein ACJX0J_039812, partial [Zea mays]